MSNDPKETKVDLSKLLKTSSTTSQAPVENKSNSTLRTSLNEGVDSMIGHEIFELKKDKKNNNLND